MPIGAHVTGGHSTLDVLIGLALTMWALAGAAALIGALIRFAHRRRAGHSSDCGSRGSLSRLRGHVDRPGKPVRPAPLDLGSTIVATTASEPTAYAASKGSDPRCARVSPGDHGAAPRSASLPAVRGARCSPETLEPLAQYLATARRLAVAEARVARILAALPSDRWIVERYVLFAGQRIPFLILGGTGVFAVCALTGPPLWDELRLPSQMEAHVKQTLPGYSGPVRVGLCRALADGGIEPRWWCRPGEPGAWVMGLQSLIPWIEHFGDDHGLGATDIERLRELATPHATRIRRVPDVVPDLG